MKSPSRWTEYLDTYSVLATASGLALAPWKRKIAGLLLLSVGVGYAGHVHFIVSDGRLSHYRQPHVQDLNVRSLVAHGLVGALGLWLLSRDA